MLSKAEELGRGSLLAPFCAAAAAMADEEEDELEDVLVETTTWWPAVEFLLTTMGALCLVSPDLAVGASTSPRLWGVGERALGLEA